MKTLERLFGILLHVLRWICLGMVLGMSVLVVFSVFFRYALNDPIVWSDEVIMLMLLSLTYLGAALAASQRGHISVELLESIIKKQGESALKKMRLIQDLVIVVVLGVIAVYAFKIARFSQDQQTDVMLLSYFWVYFILCVGMLFMILMIFKRICEDWHFGKPNQ